MFLKSLTLTLAIVAYASSETIQLVTFDGAPSSTHTFTELNDPIMGGQSTGTWSTTAKYGTFDGNVVDVPSLKAPGFIKASANGVFPDVSSALGGNLVLMVRTSTPTYAGFRVAFAADTVAPSYACSGGGSIPFSRGCFKAKFSVPAGDDFVAVKIPFTDFSDMWSPATGEHTKECSTDADVCPTAKSLKALKRFEIWAEGAKGKVHLDVSDIMVESATVTPLEDEVVQSTVNPGLPAQYETCSGAVQKNLRYSISTRTGAPAFPNESLAVSVCCDKRMQARAEPRFLFEAPDIQLFPALDKASGVTTFYDVVCGVPLFRAPMNRSLADFEADTTEHGWPSFRPAELIQEHVVTNKTSGYVTSSCGTHLGSFLPDAKGARWCLDLACVSGNPAPGMK